MRQVKCPYCNSHRLKVSSVGPDYTRCQRCKKSFKSEKQGKKLIYTNEQGNVLPTVTKAVRVKLLPGEVYWGIKNEVTREYKHVVAKTASEALEQLDWPEHQVRWKTPIMVNTEPIITLGGTEDVAPVIELPDNMSQEALIKNLIAEHRDKDKEQIYILIAKLLKDYLQSKGKPVSSDEHLLKRAKIFYSLHHRKV